MKPATSCLKDGDRVGFDQAAESAGADAVPVKNTGLGNLKVAVVAA